MDTVVALAPVAIGVAVVAVVAWALWRKCYARSHYGDLCDLTRGHGGLHRVDHARDVYFFTDNGHPIPVHNADAIRQANDADG